MDPRSFATSRAFPYAVLTACCVTHRRDAGQLANSAAAAVSRGVVLDVGCASSAIAMRLPHLRPELRLIGVQRGRRAAGPLSRVRNAFPQLTRLFLEARALAEGTPRRFAELRPVGSRSLLIPHSIVRLHRPMAQTGGLE